MLIPRLTVLLVLFVLLINLLFGRPLLEPFLFSLALAVGLTPELLPMIITVTLAPGRRAHGARAGHRQTAARHTRPGQHGRAVQRQGRFLVVKGSPEDMLALSSTYRDAGSARNTAFDAAARARAAATLDRLNAEGLRLLGVAWREVPPERDHDCIADESDLIFSGFVALLDPPKASARPALQALARLSVSVKIITGDSEGITRHVATALGSLGIVPEHSRWATGRKQRAGQPGVAGTRRTVA